MSRKHISSNDASYCLTNEKQLKGVKNCTHYTCKIDKKQEYLYCMNTEFYHSILYYIT